MVIDGGGKEPKVVKETKKAILPSGLQTRKTKLKEESRKKMTLDSREPSSENSKSV